jgi:carboxyl-terminal processing protease
MRRKLLPIAFSSVVLLCGVLLGVTGTLRLTQTEVSSWVPLQFNKTNIPDDLETVSQVWDILQTEHVDGDKLDSSLLKSKAIEAMIQETKDRHTAYIPPGSLRTPKNLLEGSFEGIGAQVTMDDGFMTIVTPLVGSPAERSGLKPGDVILAIDGIPTDSLTLEEGILLVRGPKGTEVVLTIQSKSDRTTLDISVTRDTVDLQSVFFRWIEPLPALDGKELRNILYVQITSFRENTDEQLEVALQELDKADIPSLLLDLQYNPGGLLNETLDIASRFLGDKLILYQEDRDGNRQQLVGDNEKIDPAIPIAVLVNEGSASASEVLASSLQAHKRATIIGRSTYGKGRVSSYRQLADEGTLYYSIARWYSPNGTQIDGDGVTPDILVPISDSSEDDPIFDAGIRHLHSLYAR